METPEQDLPNFENPWYKEMKGTWDFLSDLLAGQTKIKQKRTVYLPQETAELHDDYQRRLERSVYFEDYRDCVTNLTGLLFKKPPKLSNDVPVEIRGLEEIRDPQTDEVTQEPQEGWAENIDLAGTHINVFLQRVFEDGFNGHSFIVVERPARPDSVVTAADEQVTGARSYWCMRSAADAVNWHAEQINGRTVLTQITFKECTSEPNGRFGVVEVIRYRVYKLDEMGNAAWELWIEKTDAISNTKTITLDDQGPILNSKNQPLKRLPIAVHYGEYEDFLKSRPPLKGVADINLAYYQKYSDLTNIERFTCAVTLVITGADAGQLQSVALGGNRLINLPDNSKAEFLEVKGQSIPFLKDDLLSLEKRMVHKGLDFVREEHRVPTTATEVRLSFGERTSKLSRMARGLVDCAEEALDIMAEIEGLAQGGSLMLGIDDDFLMMTPAELRFYSEMNERGQLSLPTLWLMMGRANLLPDNFDPVNELQILNDAALRQMEINAKQFDTGFESTP